MASIRVPGFQKKIYKDITLVVPTYMISKEQIKVFNEAVEKVPEGIVNSSAVAGDYGLYDSKYIKLVQKAFGKRFVPLTPTVAKRLEAKGQTTVPALCGQWIVEGTSRPREMRRSGITLLTLHVPSLVLSKQSRCQDCLMVTEFSSRKVSEVVKKSKVKELSGFTYELYIYQGIYGSGSGHDPVFVYV